MNNHLKTKFCSPWNITLFFGLMAVASLIIYQLSYLPDYETLLSPSKDTSYQSFKEHSQYKLIIDLQKSFVRNAKNVGPSVVNISKVHEVIEHHSTWHQTFLVEKQSWFLTLKSWLNKKLKGKKYISETIGSGVFINKSGFILTNYHVI